MSKKYYLAYVKRCAPELKQFSSKKAMLAFIKKLSPEFDDTDTYLDYSFSSDDIKLYSDWNIKYDHH